MREETTENLCKCIYETLTEDFGLNEHEYDHVAAVVDLLSRQYQDRKALKGAVFADNWLKSETAAALEADFMLPVVKTPKKSKDWQEIAVRRSAAALTVRMFAGALNKSLKMDPKEIKRAFERAKERYRDEMAE